MIPGRGLRRQHLRAIDRRGSGGGRRRRGRRCSAWRRRGRCRVDKAAGSQSLVRMIRIAGFSGWQTGGRVDESAQRQEVLHYRRMADRCLRRGLARLPLYHRTPSRRRPAARGTGGAAGWSRRFRARRCRCSILGASRPRASPAGLAAGADRRPAADDRPRSCPSLFLLDWRFLTTLGGYSPVSFDEGILNSGLPYFSILALLILLLLAVAATGGEGDRAVAPSTA